MRTWKPSSSRVTPSLSGSQVLGTHSFHPLLAGKPYGADDFLPVLMYVLARSNLTEMLLNVEYMMELMDPALQLGEGESAPPQTHHHLRLITCSQAGQPSKGFFHRTGLRLRDVHTGPA